MASYTAAVEQAKRIAVQNREEARIEMMTAIVDYTDVLMEAIENPCPPYLLERDEEEDE